MGGMSSLHETYEYLKVVLGSKETFDQVVDTVFKSMDRNGDGELDSPELGRFIVRACSDLGHK